MNKKAVDLFCGCGGLSLGLINAGFDVVLAVDNWQPALDSYNLNRHYFKHEALTFDLTDADASADFIKAYSPGLIAGGPPCQDFSHAGKRNENLGRGNLTVSYAEIISQIKPKFFLMENVDRLVGTNKYQTAQKILKESDYGITVKLLDASLCGVPQFRKRYFVIGELGGEDDFLSAMLEHNLSKKPLTVREYFGDSLDTDYYYRHPRNYSRRAVYSIDEPSPTIRGVNRPIPPGYKSHPGDATTDLSRVRTLTTKERSYIQTFPKDFKFNGTKTNTEQLIGNAVPPRLAEYVGKCLLLYALKKESNKRLVDYD